MNAIREMRLLVLSAAGGVLCATALVIAQFRLLPNVVSYDRAQHLLLLYVQPAMPGYAVFERANLAIVAVWSLLFVAGLVAAFATPSRCKRAAMLLLFGAQVLISALLLAAPLPNDPDQYAYVTYGVLADRRENPYVPPRLQLQHSPDEASVARIWGNPIVPDRYGPAWTIGDAAMVEASGNTNVDTKARVLRAMAALAAVLCSTLIVAALSQNRFAVPALFAFALNPLVLRGTATGAHNDIYIALGGLLTVVLLRRRQYAGAAIALALAIAVKFAYAPLVLPFLAYVYYRDRSARGVGLAAVAFCAAMAIVAVPFGFYSSLIAPALAVEHQGPFIARYLHTAPAGALVLAAFVALVLYVSLAIVKGRQPWTAAIIVMVALLCLAAKTEWWYALILTPLLLVPRAGAIAAFAGICVALQFIYASHWDYPAIAVVAALTAAGVLYGAQVVDRATMTTTASA